MSAAAVLNPPTPGPLDPAAPFTGKDFSKSTVSTEEIKSGIVPKPPGPNQLYKQKDAVYGDWRDDLARDGFVVVKGAVPKDRALAYGDEFMSYLENFAGGLGFKRDDVSTATQDKLPMTNEKGMIMGYGISHESFFWDIRQEPGVIEAFEKIHDTEDLLVSFDVMNIQWAHRPDAKPNKPWPHQDQDPRTAAEFRCMQGLVNIFPNGTEDGGLIVCKGAHLISEEFHAAFADEPDRIPAWTPEWYGFTESGMKWLADKGCEWIKPNAEPGDLLLWDSRTPHYNLPPRGANKDCKRLAFYTCYGPVTWATPEQLQRKKDAFEKLQPTTHWPNALHAGGLPIIRDGQPCPYNTGKPRAAPKLGERGYKLTGVPYVLE